MIFTFESVQSGEYIAKGGCYLCTKDHTDHYGPLIDLDSFIEGEGRLVVCSGCAFTVATLLGWALPEEVTQVAEHANALKKENSILKMRLGKTEKALRSVRDLDVVGRSDGNAKVSIPVTHAPA